jgi:hypothetical protein
MTLIVDRGDTERTDVAHMVLSECGIPKQDIDHWIMRHRSSLNLDGRLFLFLGVTKSQPVLLIRSRWGPASSARKSFAI